MPFRTKLRLISGLGLWLLPFFAAPLAVADEFHSLGLEPAWSTQVQVPIDGSGVVSASLWLDRSSVQEYAVVELPETTIYVASNRLGEDLQPVGMEGAKSAVQVLAARVLGRSDELPVVEKSIGRLRLVVTNSQGLVQCYDAETGSLQWSTPCGDFGAPTYPPALCDSGVVLARGDRAYLLDWLTGKQIQTLRLPSSTTTAVSAIDIRQEEPGKENSEQVSLNALAFVFDLKGLVSGYSLNQEIRPWNSRIVGRCVGSPVRLPGGDATAVATDRGWLYVFSGMRSPGVLFRYESGSRFTGSLSAGDNAFYVGDASGNLTKISARQLGSLEWNYRLSQSISTQPLIDFGRGLVFAASEAGELNAIEDSTGYPVWSLEDLGIARVQAPLAICNGNVICRTNSKTLAAFDASSGQLLGQTSSLPLSDLVVQNNISDRLYLLELDGRLTCYRSRGRSLPSIAAVYEKQRAGDKKASDPQTDTLSSPSSLDEEMDSPATETEIDPFGAETEAPATFDSDSDPFSTAIP